MVATKNILSIVKETKVENSFKAVLYKNGIVEIFWDKALEMVEVKHLAQRKEVLFDFGGGKKMPLYMNNPDFLHISKDALKFGSTEENGKYTLATALLLNSLAKKLAFNFYMLVFKPKTPTKGFNTREEAFEWLEKLQEDYRMKQL